MINFWFFQLNEKAERYSTQMSQYAAVAVPGQHVTVRGTLLIKFLYKSGRIVQNSVQLKNFEIFQVFVQGRVINTNQATIRSQLN